MIYKDEEMLEIKNVDVYGLDKALIRSGYPMQTGEPLDFYNLVMEESSALERGMRLGKVPTGTGHDNYLKGIIVQFDVKYPQYWTPQFQRYSFADIISSQSKMHKLTSVENLREQCNEHVFPTIIEEIATLIEVYNTLDESAYPVEYRLNDALIKPFKDKKEVFMAIVSNLPMGYEMWMGISTNYLQLKTIYQQRRNHKLPDWKIFCDFIEELPRFKELIGIE